MNEVLELAVHNVAVALALAAAAAAAARLGRPALAHGLCLLALVKLVTPPLVSLPLFPAELFPADLFPADPSPADLSAAHAFEAGRVPVSASPTADPGALIALGDGAREPLPRFTSWSPGALLLVLWAAGAALALGLVAVRRLQFRRVLRYAEPASAALASEVRRLGARIGLRRTPEIAVLPVALSPSVLPAAGGPLLVLPRALLERLSRNARESLVTHELAHLRRGDHWVRRLEIVVSALWWWLPLCWWLRRSLRRAEEQCCDAWVVWALPDRERAYADALLQTVDFLAESPRALPPQASGVGPVQDLKRRLIMIMEARTPRTLGGFGRTAVVLAAALLPVVPTRAQGEHERTEALLRRIEKLERVVERLADQSAPKRVTDRERDREDRADRDEPDRRGTGTAFDALRRAQRLDPRVIRDSITYRVEPGDTLDSIRARMRAAGTEIDLERALMLDPALVSNRLRVGQELVLPVRRRADLETARNLAAIDDVLSLRAKGDLVASDRALLELAKRGENISASAIRALLLANRDLAGVTSDDNAQTPDPSDEDAAPDEADRKTRIRALEDRIDHMRLELERLESELAGLRAAEARSKRRPRVMDR